MKELDLKDPQDALSLLLSLADDPGDDDRARRISEARTTLLALIEGKSAGIIPDSDEIFDLKAIALQAHAAAAPQVPTDHHLVVVVLAPDSSFELATQGLLRTTAVGLLTRAAMACHESQNERGAAILAYVEPALRRISSLEDRLIEAGILPECRT